MEMASKPTTLSDKVEYCGISILFSPSFFAGCIDQGLVGSSRHAHCLSRTERGTRLSIAVNERKYCPELGVLAASTRLNEEGIRLLLNVFLFSDILHGRVAAAVGLHLIRPVWPRQGP